MDWWIDFTSNVYPLLTYFTSKPRMFIGYFISTNQESFTKNIIFLFLSTQAVDSKSGPGQILRNALWNSKTTPDEVALVTDIFRACTFKKLIKKDCYCFRWKCCGLTLCRLPGRVKRLTDGNCIIVLQLGLLGIQFNYNTAKYRTLYNLGYSLWWVRIV